MCNKCIHKPVCSKYIATGGVNSCEHHKEGRRGAWGEDEICPFCGASSTDHINDYTRKEYKPPFCPNCGADMRGEEDG